MRVFIGLLCALGCAFAMHREPAKPTHGYHMHSKKIRATSPPPLGVLNAMNHTIDLSFKAGVHTFHLDLRLKTLQWGKDARIITHIDENGKETTMPLFHRSYSGKAYVEHDGKTDAESGDVSLTFYPDGRFTVVISTAHDMYNVELNEFIEKGIVLKGKDNGHGMHLTKFSDWSLGDAYADEHVNDPIRSRIRKYLNRKPGGRRLNQLIPFTNCFEGQASSQRAIKVGLVADPAYYQLKAGSLSYNSNNDATVVTAIVAELNKASDVYSRQFRVWLLQGTTFVGQAAAGLPMSTIGCGVDGSSRLTSLREWRSNYQNQNGDTNALWHLMTNCHPPPGTVGIAYIGVICSKSYGAGWTNNVYSSTWLTLAHELGHNFGSPHSFDNGQGRTGGIMDYGDGYYPAPTPSRQKAPNAEYAFNPLRKNDICGAIVESLTSRSSWNIAPDICWTVYSPTSTPVVTPRPTTPRPTTKQPTNRPTNRPTDPVATPRPTADPTTTRQPTMRPTATTPFPTTRPTMRPTSPTPIVSYAWVASNPARYGTCSPSCGNPGTGLQLMVYECEERSQVGNNAPVTKIVADSYCDSYLRPQTSRACDPPQGTCPTTTCGNGVVEGSEVCDPGTNLPAGSLQRNACCKPDCSGWDRGNYKCLTEDKMIDAAYMTCLNDIQHSECYVYLFQGEYFNKFYAVPGYRYFYSQAWTGARKHRGVLQNSWNSVTAVAGGQNGRVYVFNNLDYELIDYSDESQGKTIASGNLVADYGLANNAEFNQCGMVTAADVYQEIWLMVFCKDIYSWIHIPSKYTYRSSYPADRLFYDGLNDNVGVNAMYFDDRYNQIRVFRRNFQSAFFAAGAMVTGQANATTNNIFQDGISQNQCSDPNCITCKSATECGQCTNGYTVDVSRCIPSSYLLYLTFAQNSANDAFYSTDPALKSAQFVADHGGNANSAMMFTPTTQVTASAPGLNGRAIQNFRIEVFYKPRVATSFQTLLQIDDRFTVNFTVVSGTTFKVWVQFDHLTFDCYVNTSLTVGQWNTIAVEMAARQIITYVNGMQHNRGYSQIAGGPPLGLTFQKVVIGGSSQGLDGALDSFVISEVPVTSPSSLAVGGEEAQPAWVIPVAIVGTVLGFCLVAGLVYLCYSRGLCGDESSKSNDAQTAFLNASGQNESDQQYVRMT